MYIIKTKRGVLRYKSTSLESVLDKISVLNPKHDWQYFIDDEQVTLEELKDAEKPVTTSWFQPNTEQ